MCLVMRRRVTRIREEETPSTAKPRSLTTPSLFVTEKRSTMTPTPRSLTTPALLVTEKRSTMTPKPRSLTTPALLVTEKRSTTTPTVATKTSQMGLIKTLPSGLIDTNLTRIDFFNSTWFRDFVAIRAFLSRTPPMNRRDLLTWHKRLRYSLFLTCSCRGYSEGRFSSHSAILSNACIARRYTEVYLHEKKPHLQREANAVLHTNDFYCSTIVDA